MPKAEAASYLSGLVIGTDVATSVALFGLSGGATVHLVCTPALAALYDRALAAYNVKTAVIDGDAAALAGLTHIYSELP
jgi:2-dehydro-3-deoxygalactonokinase